MAVDVSRIPNNNKFDPVREAILQLQTDIEDTGNTIGNGTLTIGTSGSLSGSGTFTANQSNNTTITIGIDDSDYLSLSDTGEQTIAGDIVISGDLTVSGTTTYINTTNLNIGDNIITLNADLPSGTAPTENAGIEINRGSSTDVSFVWNETSDKWTLGSETLVAGTFEGLVIGNVTGDLTGNASTATALETARNIAVDGAVTGNADFDGSGDITITTTVNHNHDDRYYTETESDNRFVNVDGDTMTDSLNFDSGSKVRLHSGSFADANDRYEIFATGDVMFLQYWDNDQGNGASLQKVILSIDGTGSQREATLFGDLRLKSGNVASPTYDAVVLDLDAVNGHVDITNVRNGSFSGDLTADTVTATTTLTVGTTNVYDSLPTGITHSTTDNRLKIGVDRNGGGTTEHAIVEILLSDILSDGFIPYVATGGAGSATVNSYVSDSWLKINSDTLELGASDPVSHEIRYARFLWQAGSNDKISTVYGAKDITASIQYLGGSTTAKIEFTGGSGGGRIQFNDEYTFPATDGTSGQVLSTNGSGDLSWVAAGGPTTSDLQDVTDNGATTNNQIVISKENSINTTTPGTGTGFGLHFGGQSTADYASGITFNGGTTGTTAQAGIYVQGSGAYGTKMYIATTDSYATGAKTAISIDHTGKANFERTTPTAYGNVIWHAGNDGAGSGLDADLVDGLHGYQFLRNDANTDKQGWLKVYSAIGASDNVRTGLAHYDTTSQAEGVGGQLVLGYKYISDTNYTEGAILKTYKENSTSGHYGSGLKIQVRNDGEDLATKMRLSPSGHLLIGGDKNPNGTLEVFQEAVGASGFWVDANATNRSQFETLVFENYTRLQTYGGGTSLGGLSLNPLGNNVGVGVVDPAHKLHVKGDFGVNNGSFFLGDTTDTDSGIQFYKSGSEVRIYRNEGSFGGTYTAENVSLELYSGSTYATKINGNGISFFNGGALAVGATSVPSNFKFHVVSSTMAGNFVAGNGGYTALRFDGSNGATIGSITTVNGSVLIGSENSGGTGSNGEIQIQPSSGDAALFIDSSKRIGIGTTSPNSRLHVVTGGASSAYASADRGILVTDINGARLILEHSGASSGSKNYVLRSESGIFSLALLNDAGTAWTADNILNANSSGNVGIGTTTPSQKLTVNGNTRIENGYVQIVNSSNPSLYINNTVVQWQNYIPSGTNNLSFKDGINDVLVLGYNGANSYFNNTNVGIGTTSPATKLDVRQNDANTLISRVWNSGTGHAVMRIASSANVSNSARLEFSDSTQYNAVVSGDRTEGIIFRVGSSNDALQIPIRAQITQAGHFYFNEDIRNNGQGVGVDILNIRGRSNGQYIRLMGGENGFGIVDSGWSSTMHFRNMNSYGHIYHNGGQEIWIGNGTNHPLKLTGQLKLGVFSQSQTNTGDAWFGRAGDRAAGSATIQLGTNTSSKFEIVDYSWSNVLFEVNHIGDLYAKRTITSAANAVYSNNYYNSTGSNWIEPAGTSNIINLKLRSNANFDIYDSTNNAHVHCDARPEGSYAAAYKYTGADSGGYGYYKEYWWDGNSYQSIAQIDDSFRFSCKMAVNQTTAPSYELDVTGTIRATSDIIAFSDARVKENVKTIDNALDKVTKLRGVSYNKIGETEEKIGVIAQEIEKVLPQVVQEDAKGMKSVAYGNIVGVLIEAIKEQQKQIDELKAIMNGGS